MRTTASKAGFGLVLVRNLCSVSQKQGGEEASSVTKSHPSTNTSPSTSLLQCSRGHWARQGERIPFCELCTWCWGLSWARIASFCRVKPYPHKEGQRLLICNAHRQPPVGCLRLSATPKNHGGTSLSHDLKQHGHWGSGSGDK